VQQLIDQYDEAFISTQVVSELTNVFLKKLQMPCENVKAIITSTMNAFTLKVVNRECILRAFKVREDYRFSWYDSLIIASSLEAGCAILFSEDMANGLVIEGTLRITDPFTKDQPHVGRFIG
jgi:predicted nucleic acid-binding protein